MQMDVLREVFLELYLPRGSISLAQQQGYMKILGFFSPHRSQFGLVSVQQQGAPGNKHHMAYHDESLGQPGPGKEVNHPQPLWQAQIPERRWLEGDGVGGGRSHSRLAFVALRAADRLRWGHAGFCWQPFVQISELPREKQTCESRGDEVPREKCAQSQLSLIHAHV